MYGYFNFQYGIPLRRDLCNFLLLPWSFAKSRISKISFWKKKCHIFPINRDSINRKRKVALLQFRRQNSKYLIKISWQNSVSNTQDSLIWCNEIYRWHIMTICLLLKYTINSNVTIKARNILENPRKMYTLFICLCSSLP